MRTWIVAALMAWPMLAAGEPRLDVYRAEEIAGLWEALGPYDDIKQEGYVGFVRVVDLDGDGAEEIVYLGSNYCVGAGFDCPNSVNVLTRLVPGKGWITRDQDEYEVRARRTGYVPNAGVQIPGEVMQLSVKKNRIDVVFIVRAESPICLQQQRDRAGNKHCPEPGRYRWAYAWTPGKLERLPDGQYEAVAPRTHFPVQLQHRWVVAGTSCEQALVDDGKGYIEFNWNRMTGKGEDVWPNIVTLVAQVPWTWRIVTERKGSRGKETPSLFILSEKQSRLIIVEEDRVRTFDRCRFDVLHDLRRKREQGAAAVGRASAPGFSQRQESGRS
jgi:hypothetical protein